MEERDLSEVQYQIVSARQQTTNSLLWQTPIMSLTAQAFLFTIALGYGNQSLARIISATLALIVALASIQILSKHRSVEVSDSKYLEEYEKRNRLPIIHAKYKNDKWYLHISSYYVWIFVLFSFFLAALIILISIIFGCQSF
jgi:hypothetical protein